MRLVLKTGPGEVQLNWSFLPTFIGANTALKTEVEKVLGPRLVGEPLDEATLDMAHDAVLEMLVEKFKELEGLREYLDALKYVGQLPV